MSLEELGGYAITVVVAIFFLGMFVKIITWIGYKRFRTICAFIFVASCAAMFVAIVVSEFNHGGDKETLGVLILVGLGILMLIAKKFMG